MITVSSVPGMDSDWLMGERGNQKGKVPITYLELLNWEPQTPSTLPHPALCNQLWSHIYIVLQGQASLSLPFSHFQMSFISMKRSLTFSRLELETNTFEWRGKENGPPRSLTCLYATAVHFLKAASMPFVFDAMQSAIRARTFPKLSIKKKKKKKSLCLQHISQMVI